MSLPPLPDDPSRWPRDPYQVLGVPVGVQAAELRRAYTRLIRHYKPEQYPEQFRRIREAYEAIQEHQRLFGFLNLDPGPETTAPLDNRPPAEDPRGDGAAPADEPPELLPPPQPVPESHRGGSENELPPWQALPPGLAEELHAIWELAPTARAIAYRRFQEVLERHPNEGDIYLRLYWLLALAPNLDAERSPCDWLVRGLEATGWEGPLRELYRREIEARPAEVLTERGVRLLLRPPRPALLLELIGWRWQAATRVPHWEIIPADVWLLRTWVPKTDEEIWVRLLLLAVDHLSWALDDGLRKEVGEYRREIEKLDHWQTRLEQELDRLDFLGELAAGWHKLRQQRGAPPAFLALVARSWTEPLTEIRRPLLAYLEGLAQRPRDALNLLDGIQRQASPVLAHFGHVLLALRSFLPQPKADDRTDEELRQRALVFLDGQGRLRYAALRPRLLEFCVQEVIAPEVLATLVENRPADRLSAREYLSMLLMNDWPLRFAWLAYRLFWT